MNRGPPTAMGILPLPRAAGKSLQGCVPGVVGTTDQRVGGGGEPSPRFWSTHAEGPVESGPRPGGRGAGDPNRDQLGKLDRPDADRDDPG